jgi:SAM-dependent methyltransferase
LSHVTSGRLLDVGCGLLEVPGYLDFEDRAKFEFFGVDPIDDKSFRGMRIVGCAEFTPFQEEQFDAIIFATSLDHVCSIHYTIKESHRILRRDGKVIIWMSDRSESFIKKLTTRLRKLLREMKHAFTIDKFVVDPEYPMTHGRFTVYPNHTVLYIPNGAVDPFHTHLEDPEKIVKIMKKSEFRHIDTVYNNKDEMFLCFAKNNANEI